MVKKYKQNNSILKEFAKKQDGNFNIEKIKDNKKKHFNKKISCPRQVYFACFSGRNLIVT